MKLEKEKESIVLHHPKFGRFEGVGDTIKEASKNCLIKIAKHLKEKSIKTDDIKTYLNQASKLIVQKVSRR